MKLLRFPSAVLIMTWLVPAQAGILIDDFNSTQAVTTVYSVMVSGTLDDPNVLGGNRDLIAIRLTPRGWVSLSSNQDVPGALGFSTTAGTVGTGIVQWDGNLEFLAEDLNPSGLDDGVGTPGYDLTAGGLHAFMIRAADDRHTAQLTLRVYNFGSGAPYSAAVTTHADGGLHDYDFPFLAFTTQGADMTRIGAIELVITGEANLDATLDFVTTHAPEPGPMALMGAGLVALGLYRRRRTL